jgi:hypothetical protein
MELGTFFVESAESIIGSATLDVSSPMRTDRIDGRNGPTNFNSFTLGMILWGSHAYSWNGI